jgi:hypothetical protein
MVNFIAEFPIFSLPLLLGNPPFSPPLVLRGRVRVGVFDWLSPLAKPAITAVLP